MSWFSRFFSRKRRYDDISVSIQEHLDERIEELMEEGMSRDAAGRIARLDFGNVTLAQERSREMWQWQRLESLLVDLKYVCRRLRRSPGFAITVVLTLANTSDLRLQTLWPQCLEARCRQCGHHSGPLRRASHAARLGGHPNAVPVFFGELDGLFFITMPHVEGEDLDKFLKRTGPLPEPEAIAFAAQISSLLSFAETAGIAHCDLTPANIRLDVFGTYRVLDFGISHSEAFSYDGTFRGSTPLYTSPEQLRGEAADHRSDLYALGAIIAEILTGQPLFHAETLSAIDQRHLDGAWHMPPTLNEKSGLGLLLKKLLATKREDRLQSAFELSGILDGLSCPRPEFRERLALNPTVPVAVPINRRSRLSQG